jgi:hypothetical protein
MALSPHAQKLREIIEKAIEDHQITRSEMDEITTMVTADGHIDSQEQALLDQLHDMIQHKEVKVTR